MVKNHQHGAVGAVKHGSADHLRDGAKRTRLDDAVVPTVAATPALPDVLSADALGNLTIEDKSDADALVAALSTTNAVTTLDMRRVGFGPEVTTLLEPEDNDYYAKVTTSRTTAAAPRSRRSASSSTASWSTKSPRP